MKKKRNMKQIIAGVEAVLKKFEPIFTKHDGGAELVAVESDSVILRLLGNCQGCGMAGVHFGVEMEEMIKKRLPQIKEISYTY
jgi:Fe-S cluster biogenesis protein NfuA